MARRANAWGFDYLTEIDLVTIMSYGKRKEFYRSKRWQKARAAYIASVGGLCERCFKDGRIVAGVIVHHKQYLRDDNLGDTRISLDPSNLELLCIDCHNKEHHKGKDGH